MPMTPAVAFARLTAHPRTFLRRYPIRVAGAPVASGIMHYYIRNHHGNPLRPGRILRTRNMHQTEGFYVDNVNLPGGFQFSAYSVRMVQSNVAPIVLYHISAVGGPNIMVTGALSGCAFIVDQGANHSIDCAHLQPNGETSVQLDTRLTGNYTAVYGRDRYDHVNPAHPVTDAGGPAYDRSVTIIGVRRNGRWKVYAQKLDPLNSYSIRSVHRIYPAD